MAGHDTGASFRLVDLHAHSHCSDGALAPSALVALAAQRGLAVLALTDHDTTAGCAEALDACRTAGIGFIPGAELTCGWRNQEIHVVGLGLETGCVVLQEQLSVVRRRRLERIAAIGERLARHPACNGWNPASDILTAGGVPTRLHVARALVARGLASGTQAAFDRFLGRGQPGHVPAQWPDLEDAVQAILAAGGQAVLAHAHRYRLSNGALGQLCHVFRSVGGTALEVSLPGISPNDTARLLRHARLTGLAGSMASDFHEPGVPWRPLGRLDKLPDGIEPILSRLQPL
jgi:3',5'-nucleoside bisphosphate phosphatase